MLTSAFSWKAKAFVGLRSSWCSHGSAKLKQMQIGYLGGKSIIESVCINHNYLSDTTVLWQNMDPNKCDSCFKEKRDFKELRHGLATSACSRRIKKAKCAYWGEWDNSRLNIERLLFVLFSGRFFCQQSESDPTFSSMSARVMQL